MTTPAALPSEISDKAYIDPELRPAPPVRSKYYAGYHKCYDAAIPIKVIGWWRS